MNDNPDNPAVTPQPAPTGMGQPIIELVLSDLQARAAFGLQRYGSLLRAYNGRIAYYDAYQEALDLVLYLRQWEYEQEQGALQQYPNLVGFVKARIAETIHAKRVATTQHKIVYYEGQLHAYRAILELLKVRP